MVMRETGNKSFGGTDGDRDILTVNTPNPVLLNQKKVFNFLAQRVKFSFLNMIYIPVGELKT